MWKKQNKENDFKVDGSTSCVHYLTLKKEQKKQEHFQLRMIMNSFLEYWPNANLALLNTMAILKILSPRCGKKFIHCVFYFKMRPRISINGFVRRSVRRSVRLSVSPSVMHSSRTSEIHSG